MNPLETNFSDGEDATMVALSRSTENHVEAPIASADFHAIGSDYQIGGVTVVIEPGHVSVACVTSDRVGATEHVLTLFKTPNDSVNIDRGNLYSLGGLVYCGYELSGSDVDIAGIFERVSALRAPQIKRGRPTGADREYEFDLVGINQPDLLRNVAALANKHHIDIKHLSNESKDVEEKVPAPATQSAPESRARRIAVVAGRVAAESEQQFKQFETALRQSARSKKWRVRVRRRRPRVSASVRSGDVELN